MGWMSWFWVLVIVLVVWSLGRSGGYRGAAGDSPEAILKRRYARGEMDRDEFERRLGDLRK